MVLIQNLPFDILAEIFLLCLPKDPRGESQPNPEIAPILLCHICLSWRNTALHLPKLWARLCLKSTFRVLCPVYCRWSGESYRVVHSDDREAYLHPRTLEFLEWWRHNAGSFPIDLYLVKICEEQPKCHMEQGGQFLDGFQPNPKAIRAVNFAVDALRSVRHFKMAINRDAMKVLCEAATSTTFERLESLSMHQYFHIGIGCWTKFRFAFPHAPLLRRLHLSVYRNTLSFCWTQLTHISITTHIEQEDWLEILQNCNNLVCGAFKIHPDSEGEGPQQIVHTKLRQLVIVPTTFRSVSFPALKALRLIRGCPIDNFATLAEFLKETPALSELIFDAAIFDPEVFSLDSVSENECSLRALVPDLERLTFYRTQCGIEKIEKSAHTIFRLLKSGWTKLVPRSGRTSYLEIRFEVEVSSASMSEDRIAPEDLDIIKKSGVVQAIDELCSEGDLGYEVHMRFPSVGDRKRDRHASLWASSDLPRWDEAIGFHGRLLLAE